MVLVAASGVDGSLYTIPFVPVADAFWRAAHVVVGCCPHGVFIGLVLARLLLVFVGWIWGLLGWGVGLLWRTLKNRHVALAMPIELAPPGVRGCAFVCSVLVAWRSRSSRSAASHDERSCSRIEATQVNTRWPSS